MRFKIFLIILIFFFIFPVQLFAKSSYVLPYPSFMPGSPFYGPHLLWEIISKYFYFGSLSQFKYNLKESDKYLVEAKTLFEYEQYAYAVSSLKRSNDFFFNTLANISTAKVEGKNTSGELNILKSAKEKHIEVLKKAESELPETVNWVPEKNKPQVLNLKKDIDEAIALREKVL